MNTDFHVSEELHFYLNDLINNHISDNICLPSSPMPLLEAIQPDNQTTYE